MSKHRWKDTLPSLEEPPDLAMAASLISYGIRGGVFHTQEADAAHARSHAAAWAAAHIRAYRKTLGVKSERRESRDEGMTPDELLWSAMSHLCYAGLFHDDEYAVYHLRAAEADLRELWKRGRP